MVNVAGLTPNNQINGIQFKSNVSKAKEESLLKREMPADSFELGHLHNKTLLSKEDKQEIIRSARQKASGWAIFGGIISTMYYGLRSDKTVAKKYNLDVKNDSKLIKKIKKEQAVWTLPSAIPGPGSAVGVITYIYNRNMNTAKIDVKDV